MLISILGPTNIRDGVGTLVDSFLDPLSTEVDRRRWISRVILRMVSIRGPIYWMSLMTSNEHRSITILQFAVSIASVARTNTNGEAMPRPSAEYQLDDEDDKRPRDKDELKL